jgi:hypothetical protein
MYKKIVGKIMIIETSENKSEKMRDDSNKDGDGEVATMFRKTKENEVRNKNQICINQI